MHHCEKIAKGRSPLVDTEEQWKQFTEEIDLITQSRSSLGYIWLSPTEGDKERELATLDHWPETELVNNETCFVDQLLRNDRSPIETNPIW